VRVTEGKLAAPLMVTALWGCVLLLFAAGLPPLKGDAPHAVVAGTVFRENGFALPGAAVTLAVKDAPGVPRKKIKQLQSVSDGRGEFAFRVSPGAATYVVGASLKGFQSVEKEASVAGEERVEVTLVLPAESK
jgi:Carboxypeptidase regulatory-like domain